MTTSYPEKGTELFIEKEETMISDLRPKKAKKHVAVWLDPETIKKLDDVAAKHESNRSHLMRVIIAYGLEKLELEVN